MLNLIKPDPNGRPLLEPYPLVALPGIMVLFALRTCEGLL